jgi:manganese/zinc/iron transport system permease protein
MMLLDYTTIILLTSGIFGATAGVIGAWLFLEKKSLFCDTIAHATFPGITLIFLLTHSKNSAVFMIAATVSCLLVAYLINQLQQNTTLKRDTILGIMLAASFGIGSMLLSKIQQQNIINSGLITKYFLGNPATIMHQDCGIILLVSILSLFMVFIYKRQYSSIIFDPIFSKSIHIPTQQISSIMLLVITLTIIAGLQIIGIILMSSLLINPAATAYQWTKNLTKMLYFSAVLGFLETALGIYLSSIFYHLPPGPVIIVIATVITFVSIFLSPQGVIIHWYKNKLHAKDLSTIQLLSRFLLFNESKTDPFYAHNIIALEKIGKVIPTQKLIDLQIKGYVTSPQKNFWALTPTGLQLLKRHKDIVL